MNEKHVKISIQEEVIDHGKKRKERKYKSKINPLYIGLFSILLMAMVMSHDIKTISNEEAETNETVRSDLVKAKIIIDSSIFVLPWALSPTKIFIFLLNETLIFE